MKNNEIKNRLTECFKKCAAGRHQLRRCVVNAMNAGLTKENILSIVNKMATGVMYDEASLCAIVAIGQALRYEEKHGKTKSLLITERNRDTIENKLKDCFKKCGLARRQLRKCIVNTLDLGLTKEEVLALSDDIVGGFGKDGVSLCAIVAVNQVLEYEDSLRTKPLDILKERDIERDDT
ncbi:MAG: hypothetical protein AYK22_02385 [Thermoplasmatales archaeon SG8-52-3]|nr:MAG: hypothetical protein AYK22_02385 [Thermoplasmatales archaeon SG8-52-3]